MQCHHFLLSRIFIFFISLMLPNNISAMLVKGSIHRMIQTVNKIMNFLGGVVQNMSKIPPTSLPGDWFLNYIGMWELSCSIYKNNTSISVPYFANSSAFPYLALIATYNKV